MRRPRMAGPADEEVGAPAGNADPPAAVDMNGLRPPTGAEQLQMAGQTAVMGALGNALGLDGAFFWDGADGQAPPGLEDHPDWLALQALREETSPEDLAVDHKLRGDEKLATGRRSKRKLYLRDAIDQYTLAIAARGADRTVGMACYNNRAFAHMLIGNWRSAIADAKHVLDEYDPGNIKAHFRATKCLLRLELWDEALVLVEGALDIEPGADEFLPLREQAEEGRAAKEKKEAEAREREASRRAPAKQTLEAVKRRGVRVGSTIFSHPEAFRKPRLEGGALSWPVMFLYPEVGQMDFIEAFHELDSFEDHIRLMFGSDAQVPWDRAGRYQAGRLRVYCELNMCPALSDERFIEWFLEPDPSTVRGEDDRNPWASGAAFVNIPATSELHAALQTPGYVVPGIPVFYLLVDGSDFEQKFVTGECV